MSRLLIKQYEIGPLNNFIYLLGDPETKEMAVIDPAWDVPFLIKEVKSLGYTLTKVFLTHGHPDHVNGLDKLLETYPVPVYISKHEAPFLRPKANGLVNVADKDKLYLGTIPFDVLHTPGHTPGCQSFVVENKIFCGDALFIDGCGRCDLPGGDPKVMYHSLYNIFMKLPDDIIIYPGHHYGLTPTDTLGHQKETNPYLQCTNLQEFLVERMGL